MGGLGQDVEIEVTAEDTIRLSMMSDRQKYAAKGLLDGREGAKVEIMKSTARALTRKPEVRSIPENA